MNSIKRATFHFFDRSMLLIMVLWLAPVIAGSRRIAPNADGIGAQHHRGRDPHSHERAVETA